MTSNLLGMDVDDLVGEVVADAAGPVLVVNPSRETVEGVVSAVGGAEDAPEVRLLAERDVLKDVLADFIVASSAADLVRAGTLALRTTGDLPQASLLLTEARVVSLVGAGDAVGGLVADEGDFAAAAYETYATDWEAAEEYTLRTPAISSVHDSLSEDVGPEAEADFESMLASLETARGDGDSLDEVTLSLLVAAKNRVLLYDISKWGEDVGIASKATFSRTKTRLEEAGLVDTEKVPIDVGRPRLRLKLADERLEEGDPADLASVAQSVLAS